jgi:hypothetical protein
MRKPLCNSFVAYDLRKASLQARHVILNHATHLVSHIHDSTAQAKPIRSVMLDRLGTVV